MAFAKANRVRETTTTSGTSDYELGGATGSYQTFLSGIGDTNTCKYACFSDSDWEVGFGTLTAGSPDVLSRDTIIESSNSDAKVSWPASGTRTIVLVNIAEKNAEYDDSDVLTLLGKLVLGGDIDVGAVTTNINGQSNVSNIVDFVNGGAGGSMTVRIDGSRILVDGGGDTFPSGTSMLFQQTAAPTGWTKQTTHNDKALRVVTGTVGTGGSLAFTTAFATGRPTSLAGSHDHGGATGTTNTPQLNVSSGAGPGAPDDHTHTITSDGIHGHVTSIDVQYVDMIIANKD